MEQAQQERTNEPAILLLVNAAFPFLVLLALSYVETFMLSRSLAIAAVVLLALANARRFLATRGTVRSAYAAFGVANLMTVLFFSQISIATLLAYLAYPGLLTP